MALSKSSVKVPAGVPDSVHGTYTGNFLAITRGSGNLMLFAGDQKVEHLNEDFYGSGIAEDDGDPEHLFRIAAGAEIGAFASQLGLISLYGRDYAAVNYIVKLNSKTPLVGTTLRDPLSRQWVDVDQVMDLKRDAGLSIAGVGYTIYLGSEFETEMLYEAAQIIHRAHRFGLVTVLWIYPRGRAVGNEKDPALIAGACGVAACLGSDFVKVNYPEQEGARPEDIFRPAVRAAGRCGVVCAGGSSTDVRSFLTRLRQQIFVSGARGNATGRNVHQKPLEEAIRMCNAISAITIKGMSVDQAMAVYAGETPLVLEGYGAGVH
ncbi:MAG TPA: aldolase [Spirochaetia bacterium]|nr:aldolase [Spirochaetia bacterium]